MDLLGSPPGPSAYWGRKSKYNLNAVKLEIPPNLISLVFSSALLLFNTTTHSVNFYEKRLGKEDNIFF